MQLLLEVILLCNHALIVEVAVVVVVVIILILYTSSNNNRQLLHRLPRFVNKHWKIFSVKALGVTQCLRAGPVLPTRELGRF